MKGNISIIHSTIYYNNSPVATLVDPTIFKTCCYSDKEDFINFLTKEENKQKESNKNES